MQPPDTVFLVGAENFLEVAERRRFGFEFAGLLPRALSPGFRRAHLPAELLIQSGAKETSLNIIHPITALILLRRAIENHFLQFLDRAGIDDGEFAALQFRVALAGQEKTLNVRLGESFGAGVG